MWIKYAIYLMKLNQCCFLVLINILQDLNIKGCWRKGVWNTPYNFVNFFVILNLWQSKKVVWTDLNYIFIYFDYYGLDIDFQKTNPPSTLGCDKHWQYLWAFDDNIHNVWPCAWNVLSALCMLVKITTMAWLFSQKVVWGNDPLCRS